MLEPVPRPPAIFCIGRNYAAHIAELKQREARQAARLPQAAALERAARRARDPPARHARRSTTRPSSCSSWARTNEIAGYAVANDVSARDLQRSEKQWTRAKGFDTSCPWGPWITTDADPSEPAHHDARQRRAAPGRQHQSDLIFKPDELIAFIAETCTLEPGAIILTGTPSGVGEAFDPPRYLQPGDVVRCEVEGLGALEHRISETG